MLCANMEQNLLSETKQLLANRGATTLVEIAKGAGVDYSWLTKFWQGRIPDASVNKVQAVHDYLNQARRTH
jgi:predicted transcriptional regulator